MSKRTKPSTFKAVSSKDIRVRITEYDDTTFVTFEGPKSFYLSLEVAKGGKVKVTRTKSTTSSKSI